MYKFCFSFGWNEGGKEMNFMNVLRNVTNLTQTWNGAIAVKSTQNAVVDLFGRIGSMRSWNDNINYKKLEKLFQRAYAENRELAVKAIFYARDCRGGMGEKSVFKLLMISFINSNFRPLERVVLENLTQIVEFGSWKDIIDIFLATQSSEYKEILASFMREQLQKDFNSEHPSLLSKWLPTINSRSKHTVEKAKKCIEYKIYVKNYRQDLIKLRRKIDITESHIAAEDFEKIDYSNVSSKCMLLNRHLFLKKDKIRFQEYQQGLVHGKAKIHSEVLFPVDIVKKYYTNSWDNWKCSAEKYDEILEQQWKALPNYMTKALNAIPVVDTSASMTGTPMNVAVSIGIYIAERNPSEIYRNKLLEFSEVVDFLDLSQYTTLQQKINAFCYQVANTDIEAVFKVILQTAIEHKLEPKELPTHLIIISDMQFDEATTQSVNKTFMENMRKLYEKQNYILPDILYWNVNFFTNNFPETTRKGIAFVSGYSPAIMQAVLNTEILEPIEVIRNAVLVERYQNIVWE
ncbi:DUF2828 family protein [Fusobacterium necrophorum]|nr:DUF2828 family protein [Fusobacterium necrophorum]AZW08891.1 DUF2828 family protein [Fusobacterium necrophorum subsp. necrophorum]